MNAEGVWRDPPIASPTATMQLSRPGANVVRIRGPGDQGIRALQTDKNLG